MTEQVGVSIRNIRLSRLIQRSYSEAPTPLPFHGWHHVWLTSRKAVEFCEGLDVSDELVEAAALTHDLNYLVHPNSGVNAGCELRLQKLAQAGFGDSEALKIDGVVCEADTGRRHADISLEAKVLSDADTFFKTLPLTQLLLTVHYLRETVMDVGELTEKILREQQPLLNSNIYFYTENAKKRYERWASINLKQWENVREALTDPDVREFVTALSVQGLI